MNNPKTVIRLHRIVAALAIGWAVVQTFQLAAVRVDFRETIAANRAAIYGVTYALTSEQAKAGQIKANSIQIKEALAQVSEEKQSDVGWLQYRISEYQTLLDQCQATNQMLSEGWTGETIIDTEG